MHADHGTELEQRSAKYARTAHAVSPQKDLPKAKAGGAAAERAEPEGEPREPAWRAY